MIDVVSPKQAALALGVSEASVKRWCDKGWVATVRTAGGHRRIATSEVMRFAREGGNALVRPELLGLPSSTKAGPVANERALADAHDALKEGDEERLVALVAHLYASGRSATDVCERVLAPALHELGLSWEHGALEVYEERRACELVQSALHRLAQLLPAPARTAPRALGGTLEGDPYTLSSAMCALALRELGYRVDNLGSGLPAEQLARAISKHRPKLVWVSVSGTLDEPALARALRTVAEAAHRIGSSLALGGRGLPQAGLRVPGVQRCERLSDLALASRRPRGAPKPAPRRARTI
jgi:excisionase family DNA binding protein